EAFAHTKQAASELGLGCVQQIGDPSIIASYGVMSTPALVIKGTVVSYGKAISVADAKALLQQHFN
ncbi:MAG: thioredoxin family protein, partial [Erysipelotrichaceae bacterium]